MSAHPGATSPPVAVVTGANAGIGLQTALKLLNDGYHVIMACRSRQRGDEACQWVAEHADSPEAKSRVEMMQLDLSSLDSVDQFTAAFRKRFSRLHLLVNNAGILPIKRTQSVDGFELTFATNHVGHFLLTLQLLECLQAAAPSRVVVLSSTVHTSGVINFDDISYERSSAGRQTLYAQSKLANILFAYEFNRRYASRGVTANAVHPGIVASNILGDAHWFVRTVGTPFMRLIGSNTEQGARTSHYVAVSPELENVGAKYFVDSREALSSPLTYDSELALKLWENSLRWVDADKRLNNYDAGDVNAPYVVQPILPRSISTIYIIVPICLLLSIWLATQARL